MAKLAYILSLPRSGSTVLSAMLDRYHGVVSPPESAFPQMLSVVTSEERMDPVKLAAIYLGSTFTPTPLDIESAARCMHGTDSEILTSLGLAIAAALGRDPEEVRAIVWKTPRIVGLNAAPLKTGGAFIILRRNPYNVFESQFRVSFGEKNRNPFRFAIFRESYEQAFAELPAERCMQVHYDDLPDCIPRILGELGIDEIKLWKNHQSTLHEATRQCSWLTTVNDEFVNKDPLKRAKLSAAFVCSLRLSMLIARPMRAFLGPIRAHYDSRSVATHRGFAAEAITKYSSAMIGNTRDAG